MDQMTESRSFHLGDLISVVTGRLVSPNHIGGAYDVCDYVTGQAHMTHQLPRACDTVKPWLFEQHPWLADVEVPAFDIPVDADRDESMRIVLAWVAQVAGERGEFHEVRPMPFGAYVGREPIAELREMAPHAQIIGVEVPPN
jgi:hypothetical protein